MTTKEVMARLDCTERSLQYLAENNIVEPVVHRGARDWTEDDVLDIRFWRIWPHRRGGSDFRRRALAAWRKAKRPRRCWVYETSDSALVSTQGERDGEPRVAKATTTMAAELVAREFGSIQYVWVDLSDGVRRPLDVQR